MLQATLIKPIPKLIKIPDVKPVKYCNKVVSVKTARSNIKKYTKVNRPHKPQNNKKVNAEKKASSHLFIYSLNIIICEPNIIAAVKPPNTILRMLTKALVVTPSTSIGSSSSLHPFQPSLLKMLTIDTDIITRTMPIT